MDIIVSDPQVRAVFVNVFGGITACDAVANGIVADARRRNGGQDEDSRYWFPCFDAPLQKATSELEIGVATRNDVRAAMDV